MLSTSSPLTSLRPRSIAELSDQIVNVYRLGFLPFLAMSALLGMVPFLLNLLTALAPFASLAAPSLDSDLAGIASVVGLIGTCCNQILQFASIYFFYPLQMAAGAVVVRNYLLHGERPTWSALWGAMRRHAATIFGLGMIYMVLSIIALFTLLLPPVGLGVLTLLTFAFYGGACAVAVEGLGAMDSLRRGWDLACYGRWRVLGLGIVFYLLIVILSSSLTGVLSMLGFFVAEASGSYGLLLALFGVGATIASLIALPFMFIAVPLTYYDFRARYEGYDLALAAAEAAGIPDHPVAPPRIQMGLTTGESAKAVLQVGIAELMLIAGVIAFAVLLAVLL